MRIAITYDFKFKITSTREGIGIYSYNLIRALLNNYNDITVEFWVYSFNVHALLLQYKKLIDVYANRIFIYTENGLISNFLIDNRHNQDVWLRDKYIFNLIDNIKNIIKKYWFFIYIKKIYKMILSFVIKRKIAIRDKKIIDSIEKSKADAVYVMHPSLTLGHYFKCIRLVQIHDLFTFQFANMFYLNNKDIKKENRFLAKNILKYSKDKSIFISSNSYTVNNHIHKYIKNIQRNQCRIIAFPPMLQKFDIETLISEYEFRKKFNIYGDYIPFASQNRPNKNLIQLLQAIKILKLRGIDIKIVTTGRVNDVISNKVYIEKNSLRKNIIEIGTISRKDLFSLYYYSTVTVITSCMEGYGMTGQCLEALMTKNTPVVHVKSFGMKESLESVGLSFENADLNWVELYNSSSLAYKIENVLTNREKHIYKQSNIINHYTKITWQNTAASYIKIINNNNKV